MNNRKTLFVVGALLVAAVTVSITGFGLSHASSGVEVKPSQPAPQDNAQTATVTVTDKGFEPASLKLKAGVPAKVTFTRKTEETCAKEVVIKDYNIDRKLPLNEAVTVEFTPRKGEFAFACGMNMLKGKLIVAE